MFKWLKRGQKRRADKQQGDPRGGVQSEEYTTADPRELVQEGDVVMSGPGGAPQEGTTPERRRDEQRSSS